MDACRYGIYFWVLNSIYHEWVQWTSEIESWTWEDIFHIYKQPCIHVVYYIDILITTFLTIFRRFLTTSLRFWNILQNLFEGNTNVSDQFLKNSEEYRRFLKMTEDCRKLSRNIQRCLSVRLVFRRSWVQLLSGTQIFSLSHARAMLISSLFTNLSTV